MAWLKNEMMPRDPDVVSNARGKRLGGLPAFLAIIMASAGFFLSGCNTTSGFSADEMMLGRFVVEVEHDGTVVSMPISGARIQVNPQAMLTEYDFLDVGVVELDLGLCLQFTLSHQASRAFYQTSANNQGKRLVLLVNGKALGLRRIDRPVSNGVIYVFVEVPDGELPELAKNLKDTSIEVQKKISG